MIIVKKHSRQGKNEYIAGILAPAITPIWRRHQAKKSNDYKGPFKRIDKIKQTLEGEQDLMVLEGRTKELWTKAGRSRHEAISSEDVKQCPLFKSFQDALDREGINVDKIESVIDHGAKARIKVHLSKR